MMRLIKNKYFITSAILIFILSYIISNFMYETILSSTGIIEFQEILGNTIIMLWNMFFIPIIFGILISTSILKGDIESKIFEIVYLSQKGKIRYYLEIIKYMIISGISQGLLIYIGIILSFLIHKNIHIRMDFMGIAGIINTILGIYFIEILSLVIYLIVRNYAITILGILSLWVIYIISDTDLKKYSIFHYIIGFNKIMMGRLEVILKKMIITPFISSVIITIILFIILKKYKIKE